MSMDTVGLTLSDGDAVRFWASRSEESATLVIDSDGTHCEIGMDRAIVDALWEQFPEVLAGMDLWATEQQICENGCRVEQRTVSAAARALDVAAAAEQVGAHQLAASLRHAAMEASNSAKAVDTTARAFEAATEEADYAASKLLGLTSHVDTEVTRLRAELARVGAGT